MDTGISLEPSVKNYAVIGNPVAHSKSPFIHHAFAQQVNIKLFYQKLLVEPGQFNAAVDEFQRQGGSGLNITLPFKEAAWRAVNSSSKKADSAQAVNIIWFDHDGKSWGDTTDGTGLLNDFKQNEICVTGGRVLVIGAGGAVRSVLSDLLIKQPESLVLVNRTKSKAEILAGLFPEYSELIKVCNFDELVKYQFDIIINGTSMGLQGKVPPIPEKIIKHDCVCYDMLYGETDTPFVKWAKDHGADKALDGLGMLVEQAAESFYLWHGIRPDTEPVIDRIRADFNTG